MSAERFHVGGLTLQDSSTDLNISGEGALLVNIATLNGLSGGLEAKADALVVADILLTGCLLGGKEHGFLLLECLLSLCSIIVSR